MIALANEVFEDEGQATDWLQRSLKIFHGQSPMELAKTRSGIEAVEQALGRIEHSVFS